MNDNFKSRLSRQKFYNSANWKVLRDYLLYKKPLCEVCLEKERITVATEVHHKIDIIDRPELRLDTNNLQPLCHDCHSKITAMHMAGSEKDLAPTQLKWKAEPLKIKKPK
jgi:5-methylcytosine-specific restriction protein A